MLATALGVVQDLVTRMRSERNLAEGAWPDHRRAGVDRSPMGSTTGGAGSRMIQRSVGQARRHGQPLCLAMLDPDRQALRTTLRPSGRGRFQRVAPTGKKSGPGSKTTSPDTAARVRGNPAEHRAGRGQVIVERLRTGLPLPLEDREHDHLLGRHRAGVGWVGTVRTGGQSRPGRSTWPRKAAGTGPSR